MGDRVYATLNLNAKVAQIDAVTAALADNPEVGPILDGLIGEAQDAFAAEDVALIAVDCDRDGLKLMCCSGVPLTSEDDEGRVSRARVVGQVLARPAAVPALWSLRRRVALCSRRLADWIEAFLGEAAP